VAAKEPKKSVTLSRVVDAPLKTVWRAWADPRQMALWWGPHQFTNPVCELDLRPGGKIRIVMKAPDGTEYPMSGVFKEVVPRERLVFTAAAEDANGVVHLESETTVTFSERRLKTKVTVKATAVGKTPAAPAMLNGMKAGWSQTVARLAEFLEDTTDRELVITRTIDAPRELIFDAVTDPKQVVHWWGPQGFTTTIHQMDVRVGGLWSQTLHGPDGKDYANRSIFLEVRRPERIVYSHGGGDGDGPGATFRASWTLEARGSKTRLTLRMIFPTVAVRNHVAKKYNAVEGGNQTLGRLEEFLAKRS
jgi:uncharacterized protein YndB with AHSA1/START domain